MSADKAEFKALFRLSMQAVLVQITLMSMTVIDIVMAGRYSVETISAISLGTNILHPMMVIVYGLFCAVNPLVAELNAKNEGKKLAQLALTAATLALVISPFYMLVIHFSPWIIRLVNINESLVPLVYEYLKCLSYGFPAFLLFLSLRFFNDGLFKSKNVLIASLLVAPVNVFFNWVFLYGKLGFPALGVAGLAYATVISWSLLALFMLLFTLYQKEVSFSKLTTFLPDKEIAKQLIKLGLPISGSIALELTFLCLIGLFAGQYLVTSIAAHQIAMSLCFIFLMIPLGISTAVTSRIGYFYSQYNLKQVLRIKHLSISFVMVICALVTLLMILGSDFLVSIYSQDIKVQKEAMDLLFYAALIQVPAGLFYTLSAYLRGLKHTLPALYISLLVYWIIGFPLAYSLSVYLGREVEGLWQGLVVAYLAGTAMMAIVASKRTKFEVEKEGDFIVRGQVS